MACASALRASCRLSCSRCAPRPSSCPPPASRLRPGPGPGLPHQEPHLHLLQGGRAPAGLAARSGKQQQRRRRLPCTRRLRPCSSLTCSPLPPCCSPCPDCSPSSSSTPPTFRRRLATGATSPCTGAWRAERGGGALGGGGGKGGGGARGRASSRCSPARPTDLLPRLPCPDPVQPPAAQPRQPAVPHV